MNSQKPPLFQHPELDGNPFFFEGSDKEKPALLLIHGFTATTVEVRQFAEILNSFGYPVKAPLLPGHGTTPEFMNKTKMKEWIESVESAYLELSLAHREILVFGESMGGLLTCYLAFRHPEIKKIFLFAPALKINGLWKSLFFWPFVPYIFKKHTDATMLWQGYNVVPLRAASQLQKLQQRVRRLLPEIDTDCLIFQGKKDQTINPSGAVEVYELLGSKNKELIWLEDSSHCILLDQELSKVVEICVGKIKKM
jgi:carboxylesterase